MRTQQKLVFRHSESNLNHHLWNNNGTWWCHVTIHFPDLTKERLRVSLQTKDQKIARLRRDNLIQKNFSPLAIEETKTLLPAAPIPASSSSEISTFLQMIGYNNGYFA